MKYRITTEKARELLATNPDLYNDKNGKTIGCLAFKSWGEWQNSYELRGVHFGFWNVGLTSKAPPSDDELRQYLDGLFSLGWIERLNGCNEPCDNPNGPCACGAWHDDVKLLTKDTSVEDMDRIKKETQSLAKEVVQEIFKKEDKVNDPNHYTKGVEVLQFISSWGLNFNIGNAIKYVVRCDHKGSPNEDLAKALFYIANELENRGGHDLITKFCERWLAKKTTLTKIYRVEEK